MKENLETPFGSAQGKQGQERSQRLLYNHEFALYALKISMGARTRRVGGSSGDWDYRRQRALCHAWA